MNSTGVSNVFCSVFNRWENFSDLSVESDVLEKASQLVCKECSYMFLSFE